MHLPSREEFPDYYHLVANPVSLGIIKTQLARGEYATRETNLWPKFERDMNLVFANARIYNRAGSSIVKDANALQALFDGFKANLPSAVRGGGGNATASAAKSASATTSAAGQSGGSHGSSRTPGAAKAAAAAMAVRSASWVAPAAGGQGGKRLRQEQVHEFETLSGDRTVQARGRGRGGRGLQMTHMNRGGRGGATPKKLKADHGESDPNSEATKLLGSSADSDREVAAVATEEQQQQQQHRRRRQRRRQHEDERVGSPHSTAAAADQLPAQLPPPFPTLPTALFPLHI